MDIKELNGRPLRLLIGGSPCVPAGTKIKVKEGYKNIEDVIVGDDVLTHKNRYRKVKDTMQKQTDSLYYIKFNGSETINITGNHPLYILRNNNIEWIRCEDIRVGDYVCININQKQEKSKYTDEELWLMGRLLADGYRDKTRNRIFISVSKQKVEEFEKHINKSGYKYYITHKDRQAPEYVIENSGFYKKCSIFKDKAISKYIPDEIINLNVNSVKYFIDGYLSGDGHKRKDRKETYMWSTISIDMVLSVAMAILKIHKKYPTITKKIEKKKYKIWNDGRISGTSDSYNSQVALFTNRTFQKIIGDKVFIPIKELTKKYVNCQVFNISVEEDESYTVNNVIVHNCTHWSIAQKNNRETKPEGLGWELFENYLIAKEKFKPDFFLYENNKSAAQPIKDQISKELGIDLQYINSALVSAQNRQRFYAHNIPGVEQPEDRGILLKDVLESGILWKEKSYMFDTDYWKMNDRDFKVRRKNTEPIKIGNIGSDAQAHRVYSCYGKSVTINSGGGGQGGKTGLYATEIKMLTEKEVEYMLRETKDGRNHFDFRHHSSTADEKSACVVSNFSKGVPYNVLCELVDNEGNISVKDKFIYLVRDEYITFKGQKYHIPLPDGYYIIRKLLPVECERLQTLPDDYTKCEGVSNTQRYRMIGNGWTAEVIIHILSHINIPKNYPIEVLSMYDGIATGRYCLERLGYKNITYKAYEIDPYAIKVAMKNYPDIIQCGDAYQVRKENWKY